MASNLRVGSGEIDLLVADGATIVAVEVKTRAGGDPMLALTAEKRRRLRVSAAALRPRPGRIDVVAVSIGSDGVTIRRVRAVA